MDKKATIFEFTSYQFEPEKKRVIFHYATNFSDRQPLFFTETILLPKVPNISKIPKEVIEKLLQSLHIILGISYYKFYCATKIAVPYDLSKLEADFWDTVYQKGLGEFFYKNNLDPNISPKFEARSTKSETNSKSKFSNIVSYFEIRNSNLTRRCLVGIGGGKDSIVAAELLKQAGFSITSLHIETGKPSKIVDDVIEIIGVGELKIQRFLDWQVHQQHLYNGHIPVSAIYALLGLFSAILYGYSYVIVGNEHSSNFGNTNYRGLEINHQWSKSFEFETLLQKYVKKFITPDVQYFSLLRSFYEIRIVKIFAKYKQYFPYFSSCNKNFKIKPNTDGLIRTNGPIDQPHASTNQFARIGKSDLWCGQCAKCMFAFLMLSAFLPKKELLKIFGKNLYADEDLLPLFKDVLGFGNMKPFDCVGTFQEAQTALFLAKKKFSDDFIMRQIGQHAKFNQEVFLTNKENIIPEEFKFLGMESAYILRYGIEGKIAKQYVKTEYPKLNIGIANSKRGDGDLKKQSNFDIAIKTPGIKKESVTIPYTTPTNIFFAKVLDKNLLIGVTGSKGKSTTSSLIYHILKTAGRDVQLLGNIGTPMLGALLKPVPKNRIFVLELSSFQLDDIAFSPDIAVITNLFPEHMDFHGGLENYYNAKKNIITFQKENNYFIHNEKTSAWLKNYKGKSVLFSQKKFESNLIGQHNQSNIGAAVAVAEILNIPQETIKKAVKSFKGLKHRLQNVGTFKGITFYDDAISTTPDSTIMAIRALSNIGTIFLGGQDRGYNFNNLEKIIKQYNIKNVVLFPDSGNKIIKNKKGLNILKTKSMKEAVAFAYKNTPKGHICLLSCASPSYSLWKNFEEKGEQFKFFVKKFENSKS